MIDPPENSKGPTEGDDAPAADSAMPPDAGTAAGPAPGSEESQDLSPERMAMQHLGGRISKKLRSSRPVNTLRDDPLSDSSLTNSEEGRAPEAVQESPVAAESHRLRIQKSSAILTELPEAIETVVSYPGFQTEGLINEPVFRSKRPITLGVTSAVPGEGKTTVALRLALDIARDRAHGDSRVCLMDMSLGEDSLSHKLNINTEPGLVNILEGTHNTFASVPMMEIERLNILPAGKAPEDPVRAARSPEVSAILDTGKNSFDVVIVDLPSIGSGNVLPIARYLDAIIVVVRAEVTPKEMVAGALEQLDQSKVIAIVLNRLTGRMLG